MVKNPTKVKHLKDLYKKNEHLVDDRQVDQLPMNLIRRDLYKTFGFAVFSILVIVCLTYI